jgi:hypothetical protein
MSYDPFASGSEVPPEYGPDAQPASDPTQARQRVLAPAIALIVVGILNLLLMVVQVGRTIQQAVKSPEELAKETVDAMVKLEEMNVLPKGYHETYQKQQGQSPESIKNQTIAIGAIVCALGLLIAILSLLGGIRMLSLRSYALCIAGAISAAIPCLSCGGSCCFGEIIGIWALIVLLNNDVRSAFQ